MAEMTGTGLVMRGCQPGQRVTIKLGDRVRLRQGVTVRAHSWCEDGFIGMLDQDDRYVVDGPGWFGTFTLAAVEVVDGDVVRVLDDKQGG